MPNDEIAAVGELPSLHGTEEGRGLPLDRRCKELPRIRPQDARQEIIDIIGLAKADEGTILFEGVSLSSREVRDRGLPPRYAAFLTPSSTNFPHSSVDRTVQVHWKNYGPSGVRSSFCVSS